jgi:hypothetical protein
MAAVLSCWLLGCLSGGLVRQLLGAVLWCVKGLRCFMQLIVLDKVLGSMAMRLCCLFCMLQCSAELLAAACLAGDTALSAPVGHGIWHVVQMLT